MVHGMVTVLLYNIFLPINRYSGSIVIAKTINNIRISHGYFIRSLGQFHQPLVIASDLLDISNPHEYADICY